LDIYKNRVRLKVIITFASLLIGGASLLYTQLLVGELTQREQRQMDLFAKTQEYVANNSGGEDLGFLITEILEANDHVPAILTDEKDEPQYSVNISFPEGASEAEKTAILKKRLQKMKEAHPPITVNIKIEGMEDWKQFIYYENSTLITQLQYFPYVQLSVIAILGILAYLIFSSSRRAEQNRIWVGLAKETAHQLGTPISGLMAWVDYLEADEADPDAVHEMRRDLTRLRTVTARFSSIGSKPALKPTPVRALLTETLDYMQSRLPKKVEFEITNALSTKLRPKMSSDLFAWVIENLCKNATDAMAGEGKITVQASEEGEAMRIDLSDTGKGIPKKDHERVFTPGFTTKKRGWGLGLALVRRIIEEYHGGRIFILKSEVGLGTTFRIILPLREEKKSA